MKRSLMILVVLTHSVYGHMVQYGGSGPEVEYPQKYVCFGGIEAQLVVTTKLAKNKYEVLGNFNLPHGILTVDPKLPQGSLTQGPGPLSGVCYMYTGFKRMPLQNGFDAPIDFLKQCKCPEMNFPNTFRY